MSYIADTFSITTTPTKIVDVADLERAVQIRPHGYSVYIGYTSSDGYLYGPTSTDSIFKFVLPINRELWIWSESTTVVVSVLVSAK